MLLYQPSGCAPFEYSTRTTHVSYGECLPSITQLPTVELDASPVLPPIHSSDTLTRHGIASSPGKACHGFRHDSMLFAEPEYFGSRPMPTHGHDPLAMAWAHITSLRQSSLSSRGSSLAPSITSSSSRRSFVKSRGGVKKSVAKTRTNGKGNGKSSGSSSKSAKVDDPVVVDRIIRDVLEHYKPQTRKTGVDLSTQFDECLSFRDESKNENRHNKSQQILRGNQSDELRAFERYLVSIGWRGPCVQNIPNARTAGIVHNHLPIMQGMNQLAGLNSVLLTTIMRPEMLPRLADLLPMFEPNAIIARSPMERAIAMQNAHLPNTFRHNNLADDCRRFAALREFVKPEYCYLFETPFPCSPPSSPVHRPRL